MLSLKVELEGSVVDVIFVEPAPSFHAVLAEIAARYPRKCGMEGAPAEEQLLLDPLQKFDLTCVGSRSMGSPLDPMCMQWSGGVDSCCCASPPLTSDGAVGAGMWTMTEIRSRSARRWSGRKR
jgi:hypothetical protein